jgi:hypothetical protein
MNGDYGWPETLVGTVIHNSLHEIETTTPDKGRWLLDLLRRNLTREEFREWREAWQLPPHWPTVRRKPEIEGDH